MVATLKKHAFGLTERIIKRDFSGNTGLALKNSIYSVSTSIISKVGSIFFVYIIMMRYLSQELFGLYSLTLSTILLFSGLSDIGINTALVNFISKKKENSRGHIKYLFKVKLFMTGIVCLFLLSVGFFLANDFYKKPIFLGLVAGVFYIISMGLFNFFFAIFQAENNFKVPLFKEVLFQLFRIVFIIAAIFYTTRFSQELVLFWIFIALGLSFILSAVFFFPDLKKYKGNINKKEKISINKYLIPLSLSVLSGLFFGHIDTVMLGRFVLPEFIAYYQAAFSLVISVSVFVSFSSVLFPIFAKISKTRLKIALKKSVIITSILGVVASAFVIFGSPFLIEIIKFLTTKDYSESLWIIRVLALILITDPLISVLSAYLYSIEKPKKVAWAVTISTLVNIILSLVFIKILIAKSMIFIVIGVAVASVISRVVYLVILASSLKKKRDPKKIYHKG